MWKFTFGLYLGAFSFSALITLILLFETGSVVLIGS